MKTLSTLLVGLFMLGAMSANAASQGQKSGQRVNGPQPRDKSSSVCSMRMGDFSRFDNFKAKVELDRRANKSAERNGRITGG